MKQFRPIRNKTSLVFGASDTTKSLTLVAEGLMKHLHLRLPNFTNAVTATVTIDDVDSYTIYTSGANARNGNYNLDRQGEWIDLLLGQEPVTITVTLSGVPGGSGGTVVVVTRVFGSWMRGASSIAQA